MELNSRGEVLSLTDSKLLIRGMQGVTERTSLNWLLGVSWMVVMLSSCVWGCSDSIAGEVIGSSMRFSNLDAVFTEIRILHRVTYQ